MSYGEEHILAQLKPYIFESDQVSFVSRSSQLLPSTTHSVILFGKLMTSLTTILTESNPNFQCYVWFWCLDRQCKGKTKLPQNFFSFNSRSLKAIIAEIDMQHLCCSCLCLQSKHLYRMRQSSFPVDDQSEVATHNRTYRQTDHPYTYLTRYGYPERSSVELDVSWYYKYSDDFDVSDWVSDSRCRCFCQIELASDKTQCKRNSEGVVYRRFD